MPSYDRKELLDQLRRHEGFRASLYFDSLGVLTLGVGHAVGSRPVPEEARDALIREGMMDKPFPAVVLDMLFEIDLAEHEKELLVLAGLRGVDFNALSPRRQMVLVNMAFNLGSTGLGRFVKMWAALAVGNYTEAAAQMLDSRWARQVGRRSEELAQIMREG